MEKSRSDDRPVPARGARLDQAGLVLAAALALGLGVALWFQAGRDVFAAMVSGLWALCF